MAGPVEEAPLVASRILSVVPLCCLEAGSISASLYGKHWVSEFLKTLSWLFANTSWFQTTIFKFIHNRSIVLQSAEIREVLV